jgi:RNA polymerase sigma-70 factor (ECF subfamily)
MAETDEDIIARVIGGEREAFALIVDRYKDRVYTLVSGIIRNRELAQDVAQEVFVKVYLSLAKFRKDARFSTWLYRIAYNTAISETRKASYKNKIVGDGFIDNIGEERDNTEERTIKEEERENLSRAISALKPDEKCILQFYYFEEKSIAEISSITALGQSNVKIKLHRTRKKLRSLMEKNGYGIPAVK